MLPSMLGLFRSISKAKKTNWDEGMRSRYAEAQRLLSENVRPQSRRTLPRKKRATSHGGASVLRRDKHIHAADGPTFYPNPLEKIIRPWV